MKNLFNNLTKYLFILIISATICAMIPTSPEEGMYPLSEIDKVDLVKAGLKIDPKEIYNPEGTSLIDALVNIGGCTGSFISENGLIITNHHCAFGSISAASTVENNYLETGFHAKNFSEEIPAKGVTVRITESYEDVSDQVLNAVKNVDDPAERIKIISNKIREISQNASDEKNSITAQVSEMFIGKTYVLFKYRIIRDVRLVYAPPQSIGNFGGETDNWVWPRHTGDFSFMRAYVSKDGSAATYSADNIPFTPKKFLKVNSQGVKEEDFVFILGYPGRTFRHWPSQYLEYQKKYLLPYISDLYAFAIDEMEKLGKNDQALKLKYSSRIKGLANTMKNYRGKLKGLNKIDLIGQKIDEEKLLNLFINSDDQLKIKYGNLMTDISEVYNSVFDIALAELWFRQIISQSTTISLANQLIVHFENLNKPIVDSQVQRQAMGRMGASRNLYHPDIEKALLLKLFSDAFSFSNGSTIHSLSDIKAVTQSEKIELIAKLALNSDLLDETKYNSLMKLSAEEFDLLNDPFINFVKKLREQSLNIQHQNDINSGTLSKLYADLVDVKMLWKKSNFIPDANSTLRLTYGYIKGYSPADAVYYNPLTTIEGVLEKNATGNEDYVIPDKLKELISKKDYGKYADQKLGSIPAAMLYNMDTTGGNSGSPILDAYGRIVGVNFDRAYEATINDFAWNESYSRSIGVDIRYVMWVLDKFSGAQNLLREIGI
ncbi:MAG: S46 family peptidase [Ignavibacteria bacterium]|nr:S46 family peptidase [Ignavibacteria bacterium]